MTAEDQTVAFTCDTEECDEHFTVDGRFNAEGFFEPFDYVECPECQSTAHPDDETIELA